MEGLDKTTYGGFVDIDPRQEKISLRSLVLIVSFHLIFLNLAVFTRLIGRKRIILDHS